MSKIIKNKYIPFGRYKCINLFGILFTKSDLSEKNLRHEEIHTRQMKEMLYIFFYIWYIIEYLIRRIFKSQHSAYREISLEGEAYWYQSDSKYLNWRPHYMWIKFL